MGSVGNNTKVSTRNNAVTQLDDKINEIKTILNGNFENTSDRQYWEEQLRKTEQRRQNAVENEEYFKEMNIYNR